MEIDLDINEFDQEKLFDFQDGAGLVPAHQHINGGGWISNTAHVDDNCYVGPSAQVFGNAKVTGNVIINDYARVYGHAFVYGKAMIYGDSQVCGNAQVYGFAKVSGHANVYENARVLDNSIVHEYCKIYGNAVVRNNSEVLGYSHVYGNAVVSDIVKLYSNTVVTRKPICVFGLDQTVTITDHHIQIGCVVIPPYYFKKIGKRIFEIMGYGKEISDKWMKAIQIGLDIHECTDRQEDIEATSERDIFMELMTGANARTQIDPKR
jgi:UDP-3-O-[3-hydroxymyristoyl] glucosamine N-acyltransferase